jgi:hypothetical protein
LIPTGLLINLSSNHPSFPASLRLMFLDFSLTLHTFTIPLRNCFCRVDHHIIGYSIQSTQPILIPLLSPTALSVFVGWLFAPWLWLVSLDSSATYVIQTTTTLPSTKTTGTCLPFYLLLQYMNSTLDAFPPSQPFGNIRKFVTAKTSTSLPSQTLLNIPVAFQVHTQQPTRNPSVSCS